MSRAAFVCRDWVVWSPRRDPLPVAPQRRWRVSLCTVCMGRCVDLKLTLPQNLADNADYPALEFVVLNYNSSDDLDDFMRTPEMGRHMMSGRIRYLRTSEPQFYSTSHSRNVAFRNSTGDILLNVDADNFTGVGFAEYVNRLANVRSTRVLFAKSKWRNHGRIGMFRHEFEQFGGYDEDLQGYGWEDYSLMGRVLRAGHMLLWWRGASVDFSRRILTPKSLVATRMVEDDWKLTEKRNMTLTLAKIERGELIANRERAWGMVRDLEVVTKV